MKVKVLILALIFVFGINFVAAQKNKKVIDDAAPPPPPVPRKNASTSVQRKDFAFVISIDSERNVSFGVKPARNDDSLADKTQTKTLADFFSSFADLQNQKAAKTPKNSFEPLVIIKAAPSLKYSEVVEVTNAARISPTQKVNIQISESLNVFISSKAEVAEEKSSIRPNPLFLVADLDTNLNLTLNNESEGSLNDTSQLEKHLAQIFKDRESNGVFRIGKNEVEKTVFMKVPLSAAFADVVKLANALRNSGADLIGLQIEDLSK